MDLEKGDTEAAQCGYNLGPDGRQGLPAGGADIYKGLGVGSVLSGSWGPCGVGLIEWQALIPQKEEHSGTPWSPRTRVQAWGSVGWPPTNLTSSLKQHHLHRLGRSEKMTLGHTQGADVRGVHTGQLPAHLQDLGTKEVGKGVEHTHPHPISLQEPPDQSNGTPGRSKDTLRPPSICKEWAWGFSPRSLGGRGSSMGNNKYVLSIYLVLFFSPFLTFY